MAPSRFTLIALRWFGDPSGDGDDVTIVEALGGDGDERAACRALSESGLVGCTNHWLW